MEWYDTEGSPDIERMEDALKMYKVKQLYLFTSHLQTLSQARY